MCNINYSRIFGKVPKLILKACVYLKLPFQVATDYIAFCAIDRSCVKGLEMPACSHR